jgi:RNA polymerase sigma-70 factor (ECF subfamily)
MRRRILGRVTDRTTSRFVRARQNPETFVEVYLHYRQDVLRFLAHQTLDPEIAFDLMAETFADMFEGIGRFRGETEEQGRAWMYTIARHELYRWRERGQVERRSLERMTMTVATLGPAEYERIEELADHQRLVKRMRPQLLEALATLQPAERKVVQARVIDQRDYDDIAEECGVSPEAVRQRLSRALRRLAGTLELDEEPRESSSEELLT